MKAWSYSSGERAGCVQKFSRKCWVCKTWEGEIALVAMPGTAQIPVARMPRAYGGPRFVTNSSLDEASDDAAEFRGDRLAHTFLDEGVARYCIQRGAEVLAQRFGLRCV